MRKFSPRGYSGYSAAASASWSGCTLLNLDKDFDGNDDNWPIQSSFCCSEIAVQMWQKLNLEHH